MLVAAAAAVRDLDADPIDVPYFLSASRTLVSPDWASTFADPGLQAGPVQLLFLGLGDRVAGALGIAPTTLLACAVEIGAAALFALAVWRLLGENAPRRAALAAGASIVAVGSGVPHGAFVDGHPAQALIPALWLLAGVDAGAGRPGRAGVLIGLSAGLETWGVLGLPVLLLSDGLRASLRGVLAQTATTLVLFAPFAAAGEFRMFGYRWEVAGSTLVSLFLEPGTPFTWWMRLVQGACAILAGAVVARRLRHTREAIWLVPLTVVGVRLALDPELNGWYFLAFETLALAGGASLLASDLVRDTLSRRGRARREAGVRPTPGL